jgi:hypothetical protein
VASIDEEARAQRKETKMSAVVLILAILGMGFLAFLCLGVASSIVLLTWDEREVGPRRVCRTTSPHPPRLAGAPNAWRGAGRRRTRRSPRDRRETAERPPHMRPREICEGR